MFFTDFLLDIKFPAPLTKSGGVSFIRAFTVLYMQVSLPAILDTLLARTPCESMSRNGEEERNRIAENYRGIVQAFFLLDVDQHPGPSARIRDHP